MIIDFELKNHKSYKDEALFTMTRDTSVSRVVDSIFLGSDKNELSRVSAIYGSNASGKTNLLNAFNVLKAIATAGAGTHRIREVAQPFVSSEGTPSQFRINFWSKVSKRKYSYELDCTKEKIVYEKLSVYTSSQPSLIFERDSRNSHNPKIKFGSMVERDEENGAEYAAKKDLETSLIFVLRQSDNKDIRAVFDFFRNGIWTRSADVTGQGIESLKEKLARSNDLAEVLNSVLPATGLGVDRMDLIERESAGLSTEERKIMEDAIKKVIKLRNPNLADKDLRVDGKEKILLFSHIIDGKARDLSKDQESDGTLSALVFLGDLFSVLRNGTTYIVDELDRSLHPSLVAQLVKIFNSKETNPNGAQLIFTTHDVTLLDSSIYGEDILDRDQVWFTDKDINGVSELYPLTSVKNTTRQETNIYKKYVEGRYGALPSISLGTAIRAFWEEERHGK